MANDNEFNVFVASPFRDGSKHSGEVHDEDDEDDSIRLDSIGFHCRGSDRRQQKWKVQV